VKLNYEYINGYLAALADLGGGCDHVNFFYCERVIYKENLQKSLEEHYYKNNYADYGYKVVHDNWHIEITHDIPTTYLKKVLQYYFFELEFSPKLASKSARTSQSKGDFSYRFIRELTPGFKLHSIKAISIKIPNDIENDTFILDYGEEYYLISFGWSD